MNKKSYDEVQKKLEKNPFDQVIPMITKDIPSYKELNSEEEKILINSCTSSPCFAQSSIIILYSFPISRKLGIEYLQFDIVSKFPFLIL